MVEYFESFFEALTRFKQYIKNVYTVLTKIFNPKKILNNFIKHLLNPELS